MVKKKYLKNNDMKTQAPQKCISATGLLKKITEMLQKIYNGKIIELSKSVQSEIADDSDPHRTKKGYFKYDSFCLIENNDKRWALGFGETSGHYPKDKFLCGLVLFQLSSSDKSKNGMAKEFSTRLEEENYFQSSPPLFMLSSGDIAIIEKLGVKIEELIEFTAVKSEEDSGTFNMDLTPVVTVQAQYQEGFVNFLCKKLQYAYFDA